MSVAGNEEWDYIYSTNIAEDSTWNVLCLDLCLGFHSNMLDLFYRSLLVLCYRVRAFGFVVGAQLLLPHQQRLISPEATGLAILVMNFNQSNI